MILKKEIVIRPATIGEVPAIRAMQERSLLELGAGFYEPGALETFVSLISTMDDAVVEEGHFFIAVTGGGRIVASGGWSQRVPRYDTVAGNEAPICDPAIAVVRSVFVDPELPRRGLGSGIMAVIEEDAASRGVRTLSLTATLSGVPLYDALGYARIGSGHIDLGEVTFPYVKMTKALAAETGGEPAALQPAQGRRRGGRSFE